MAISGAALQVTTPQINTLGNYQASQANAVNAKSARMAQEAEGLKGLATVSLGVLRGNLEGQADPAEWEQALDVLQQNGADEGTIGQLRGKPHLANVMARGTMETLKYAQDEASFDLAKQKFEAELAQAAAAAAAPPKPMVINNQLVDPDSREVLGDYRDPTTASTKTPDIVTVYKGGKEQKGYMGAVDAAHPDGFYPVGDQKADDPAKAPDVFGNEKDLFQQYSKSTPVETYETVKTSYERLRKSAEQQTGAGDMGLVYGYMKMLDPGSVVRESEFAMAAQAGDLGEQVQGLVTRLINGERLPETQRLEFLKNAEALYEESAANLADFNAQFVERATAAGVDPKRFIREPEAYDDGAEDDMDPANMSDEDLLTILGAP